MRFTTKLKALLNKPARSRKERYLWFTGLYLAAMMGMLVVSGLIHLIVAILSK